MEYDHEQQPERSPLSGRFTLFAVEVIRADVEHIGIAAELFDAYRQFYGQSSDLEGARQFLSERMTNRQSIILLAVAAQEPSGKGLAFAQLYPSFSSVRMRPIWILNDLFVAPGARNQGIALRLLAAVEELARSSEACRVVLATAKDNAAARALYVKVGYRLDEKFEHYERAIDSPAGREALTASDAG
jgi:GNAT superfamily N-acetyltransferase